MVPFVLILGARMVPFVLILGAGMVPFVLILGAGMVPFVLILSRMARLPDRSRDGPVCPDPGSEDCPVCPDPGSNKECPVGLPMRLQPAEQTWLLRPPWRATLS